MSQNLTVWKYNNIELELDLADVTDAKRYNDAYVALDNEEKAMKKDVPNYVFIQNYCAMFEHLFDSLFGDGTYEKLTGGKTQNINVAHEVYESFIDFAKAQTDYTMSNTKHIVNKYSPNRAERRAAKR